MPASVVLASASPERQRLLKTLIADFETVEPRIEEAHIGGETPERVSLRRARAKALDVCRRRPSSVVIAADTVVACGRDIMGKPVDRAEARRMLKELTSRPHRVVTGVCVVAPGGRYCAGSASAEVRMRAFTDEEIEAYLRDSDALARAGAYALRPADPNIVSLEGSETCVMGLPVEELRDMLSSLCLLRRCASAGRATEQP